MTFGLFRTIGSGARGCKNSVRRGGYELPAGGFAALIATNNAGRLARLNARNNVARFVGLRPACYRRGLTTRRVDTLETAGDVPPSAPFEWRSLRGDGPDDGFYVKIAGGVLTVL